MFAFEKHNLWSVCPQDLKKVLYFFEAPQKQEVKSELQNQLENTNTLDAKVARIDAALNRVVINTQLAPEAKGKVFDLVRQSIKKTDQVAPLFSIDLADANNDGKLSDAEFSVYAQQLEKEILYIVNNDRQEYPKNPLSKFVVKSSQPSRLDPDMLSLISSANAGEAKGVISPPVSPEVVKVNPGQSVTNFPSPDQIQARMLGNQQNTQGAESLKDLVTRANQDGVVALDALITSADNSDKLSQINESALKNKKDAIAKILETPQSWQENNKAIAGVFGVNIDDEPRSIAFGKRIQEILKMPNNEKDRDGKIGSNTISKLKESLVIRTNTPQESVPAMVNDARVQVAAADTGVMSDAVSNPAEQVFSVSQAETISQTPETKNIVNISALYEQIKNSVDAQSILNKPEFAQIKEHIGKVQSVQTQAEFKWREGTIKNAIVLTPDWGNVQYGTVETKPVIAIGAEGTIVAQGFGINMDASQFEAAKSFSEFFRKEPAKKDAAFWNQEDWEIMQKIGQQFGVKEKSFPAFDLDGVQKQAVYQEILWAIRNQAKEPKASREIQDVYQLLKDAKDRHTWFVKNRDL